MAGTSDRTEGQVALITSELLFSSGGYVDSLEGIDISSVPDGAVCYVRDVDADYRWLSLSVAAPAPPNVILPTQLAVGDPGRWVVITSGGGGGTPGAPVNSVQFNDGGAFGGSSQNLFIEAAAGLGPRQILQSSSVNDAASGWLIQNSSGATKAAVSYTEDPVPANEFSTVSGGGGLFQVDAFEGNLELKALQDLLLTRGVVTWTWPSTDGSVGQVLTTNGAGLLSFSTVASATPTWAQTLAAGGVSGGTNPTLSSGDSLTATAGSSVQIHGQNNGAGSGDGVSLSGGSAVGGNGGSISATAGSVLSGNGNGGDISCSAGTGAGSGVGGSISLLGGNKGTSSGASIYAYGGDTGGVNYGGSLMLQGGFGAVSCGSVTLLGGSGPVGGSLSLSGGNGSTTGGSITLAAGNGMMGNGAQLTLSSGGLGGGGSVTLSSGGGATNGGMTITSAGALDVSCGDIASVYATTELRLGISGVPAMVIDSAMSFAAAPTLSVIRKNAGGTALEYATITAAKAEVVTNINSNTSPSSATLEANNITYACDVSGGAITVTLPSGCAAGTTVTIKDRYTGGTQAGTNNISIVRSGAETLDGATTQYVATSLGSITLRKGTGTDWLVI